jgi:hypothetical protein
MFLSEAIWHFRTRCRSFSGCFRTRQHVPHTLSARDGPMASSVLVVTHPVSLTVSPLAPACSVVGSVAVTRVSPLARSWNARTLRSRFGSGQRTWSPVKRPAYRLFSFSGNSESRATRPRSRFFTNCVSVSAILNSKFKPERALETWPKGVRSTIRSWAIFFRAWKA